MTTTIVALAPPDRSDPEPDVLELYWQGDAPPERRRATPEDADQIIEAMLSRTRPAHVQWRHHPHAEAWWSWIRHVAI